MPSGMYPSGQRWPPGSQPLRAGADACSAGQSTAIHPVWVCARPATERPHARDHTPADSWGEGTDGAIDVEPVPRLRGPQDGAVQPTVRLHCPFRIRGTEYENLV